MSEGTAVAVAPHDEGGTYLESVRRTGEEGVLKAVTVSDIMKKLEGASWGTLKSAAMTDKAREGLAHFCHEWRAEPSLHIDILGGRIYLNAAYYTERLNSMPNLQVWYQKNISSMYAEAMRAQATQTLKDAKDFDSPELKADALRLLGQAREAEELRAQYNIPEKQAAYETTVEFTDRGPVRECNEAGGKKGDPVGNEHSEKSARTRSLRRTALKAVPSLVSEESELARRGFEDGMKLDAEDEAAARAALPAPGGPQAVSTGHGEPEAATTVGSIPLPVEGDDDDGADYEVVEPEAQDEPEPEPEFDRKDAGKRFFATLRDAGVPDKERKAWAAENGFGPSTKEWTQDDFDRAQELLVGPVRDKVIALCNEQGAGYSEVALAAAGVDEPKFLVHWNDMLAALEAGEDEDL